MYPLSESWFPEKKIVSSATLSRKSVIRERKIVFLLDSIWWKTKETISKSKICVCSFFTWAPNRRFVSHNADLMIISLFQTISQSIAALKEKNILFSLETKTENFQTFPGRISWNWFSWFFDGMMTLIFLGPFKPNRFVSWKGKKFFFGEKTKIKKVSFYVNNRGQFSSRRHLRTETKKSIDDAKVCSSRQSYTFYPSDLRLDRKDWSVFREDCLYI